MKTRFVAVLTVAASLGLTPSLASAQDSGLRLGLRAGYAIPFGAAGDNLDLSDLASGAVPLQIDLDYRVNGDWAVGVAFTYGPVFVADETKGALEASGLTDVGGHRQQVLAVQVTRAFPGDSRFSPWVSLSGGYEWTRYAGATLASGLETEVGRSGFTGALAVGDDFAVSRRFTVGPYVAVDLGRYRKNLVWVESGDTLVTDVRDQDLHGWVRAGIKLTWTF